MWLYEYILAIYVNVKIYLYKYIMINFSLNAKKRMPLHIAKQQKVAELMQREKMLRMQEYKKNEDIKMVKESIKNCYVIENETFEEKNVITYVIGEGDIVEEGMMEENIPEPKLEEPDIETVCDVKKDVNKEMDTIIELKEEDVVADVVADVVEADVVADVVEADVVEADVVEADVVADVVEADVVADVEADVVEADVVADVVEADVVADVVEADVVEADVVVDGVEADGVRKDKKKRAGRK